MRSRISRRPGTISRVTNEPTTKDLVFAIPDIAKLCWRVVRDERVPTWVRAALVGVAGYLALPWDFLPDWIPLLGQVDDFVILTLGGRMLLRQVPDPVLLVHWDGEKRILEKLLGQELHAEGA